MANEPIGLKRGVAILGAVEPPVRIELTTFRLQGECSTTELRRRGATGATRN